MMLGWLHYHGPSIDDMMDILDIPDPDFTADDVDEARFLSRFADYVIRFYADEINEYHQFPISAINNLAYEFKYYLTREEQLLYLSCLTPQGRRKFLGDRLYRLVQELEPLNAPKVTGMILELENTEILHILEASGALRAKVAEAMDTLRRHQLTTATNNYAAGE